MNEGLSSTLDKSFLIYYNEVGSRPTLSPEEEAQVVSQIHSDDLSLSEAARKKLIESNLRLVVKVAKGYSYLGMEMTDLISEGNLGLMKAVEKFDPSKGTKFSTYACFWIKQSVRRALSNKSRTIRLPIHLTQLNHSILSLTKKYEVQHGETPTDSHIAKALGVSLKKIKKVKAADILNNFTFLDEKLNEEEGGREKLSVIEDCDTLSPFQLVSKKNDKEFLEEEMEKILDERERHIIRHRFGLGSVGSSTLEELGAKHGITRERIRQIEFTALKKLRKRLGKLM